jgi:hypothetical protein
MLFWADDMQLYLLISHSSTSLFCFAVVITTKKLLLRIALALHSIAINHHHLHENKGDDAEKTPPSKLPPQRRWPRPEGSHFDRASFMKN